MKDLALGQFDQISVVSTNKDRNRVVIAHSRQRVEPSDQGSAAPELFGLEVARSRRDLIRGFVQVYLSSFRMRIA